MVATFHLTPKIEENLFQRLRPFVEKEMQNLGMTNLKTASIREIVRLINHIEKESNIGYIRMELGIPGLNTPEVAKQAEIEAIKRGVTAKYPMLDGVPELKEEVARFAKLYLNIDISHQNCIPTTGAVQGSMISFLVANRAWSNRKGTLFFDPGFNLHKNQCMVIGHTYETMDLGDFRGKKLRQKLISFFETGKISSILFSNPNNPSWMCLSEEELKIIGKLCNQYNIIVIEDIAYFAMDIRKNYTEPGKPPFQPTIAKYTNNYVILLSSSKIFSYAGQRMGLMLISDKLSERNFPDLKRYYPTSNFRHSMVYGALYVLSAGATHSAQYGLLALLKKVNQGQYDFSSVINTYAERATIVKKLFTQNGFNIIYDRDDKAQIADGFYFTVGYKNQNEHKLLKQLLSHGISALTLEPTGSFKEGIRICVSLLNNEKIKILAHRLKQFQETNENVS